MSLVLGLTGGIGSGKSTVARMLTERGFRHIDADQLARVVVEPGRPALAEIVEHFGPEALLPDGRLNRPWLGKIVFSDAEERAVLNAITHPRIGELILERLADGAAAEEPTLLDHPLLFETGQNALVDRVAVVWVDRATQLRRLTARDGLAEEDALARIRAQMDLDEKARLADFVIDNSGSIERTRDQVDDLCRQWCAAP